MAIDTTEKLFSLLNLGSITDDILPYADGSLDQGDQQHLLGLYSGILASATGSYNIYTAPTAAELDYDAAPTANVLAGTDSVGLTLPDGQYLIAIRSVSIYDVEGPSSVLLFAEIENGILLEPAPAGIAFDSTNTAAAPAGKIRLAFTYEATASSGDAVSVQVARKSGAAYDFDTPVQTIPVTSSTRFDAELDDAYLNGELVELALRAITASGRPGPVTICRSAVADTISPDAPEFITLQQTEDPAS